MRQIYILTLLATLIFISPFASLAAPLAPITVHNVPLEFNWTEKVPGANEIYFGQYLYPWDDWLARPSTEALKVELMKKHPPVEVFEARFSALINKPISQFTESYLHNIKTIDRLDTNPEVKHAEVLHDPSGQFTIETTIQLPEAWGAAINALKAVHVIDPKHSDKLDMVSRFTYLTGKEISDDADVMKIVKWLDPSGRVPQAIDFQQSTDHGNLDIKKIKPADRVDGDINEIALFNSVITLFYSVDQQHTLVVSAFALGVKQKDLDLGKKYGLPYTGRTVLLGESDMMRKPTGIGAGLPKFVEQLFVSTYRGLQQ